MFSASKHLLPRAALMVGGLQVSRIAMANMDEAKKAPSSDQIVIIGGGTAGVGVASMLANEGIKNVSVIEPRDQHFYQPLWTLVGAGMRQLEQSSKPMSEVLQGHHWIKEYVSEILPDENCVVLKSGEKIPYKYLVVAAGLQIDWDKVEGLQKALDNKDSGVVSIYHPVYATKTWEVINSFTGGKAIFNMPATLIKCAGAPQKIMWLFDDILNEKKIRDKTDVEFRVPGGAMFGVKKYSDLLEEHRKEKGVGFVGKQELVSIDGDEKVATFKNLETQELVKEKFDLFHAVPPMSAPTFIKNSKLADAAGGWVDVDKHTLQSTKYPNVFALGDCISTPNSKTAAAITKQAPIMVHNLMQHMKQKPLTAEYNGYASCPLVVGKKRVILAEFGYGGKILETFNSETGQFPYSLFGQSGKFQERFFMFLKTDGFPFAYWNLWTKGKWFGATGPFKPSFPSE